MGNYGERNHRGSVRRKNAPTVQLVGCFFFLLAAAAVAGRDLPTVRGTRILLYSDTPYSYNCSPVGLVGENEREGVVGNWERNTTLWAA
ncbi:hypothetical protein V8C34DRAFT_279446 [Trichoderma compactum]